jgi:hypothetical protein
VGTLIEDFFPEHGRFPRISNDLSQAISIKFFLSLHLQEINELFELAADVEEAIRYQFVVNEGGVKEKEGDAKKATQSLIPFQDGSADVITG